MVQNWSFMSAYTYSYWSLGVLKSLQFLHSPAIPSLRQMQSQGVTLQALMRSSHAALKPAHLTMWIYLGPPSGQTKPCKLCLHRPGGGAQVLHIRPPLTPAIVVQWEPSTLCADLPAWKTQGLGTTVCFEITLPLKKPRLSNLPPILLNLIPSSPLHSLLFLPRLPLLGLPW